MPYFLLAAPEIEDIPSLVFTPTVGYIVLVVLVGIVCLKLTHSLIRRTGRFAPERQPVQYDPTAPGPPRFNG